MFYIKHSHDYITPEIIAKVNEDLNLQLIPIIGTGSNIIFRK